MFSASEEKQLEGIVCKRLDSTYRSGARSQDWIKVKVTQTDTFIVVGYVKERGFLISRHDDAGLKPIAAVQYGFTDLNYRELLSRLKPKDTRPARHNNAVWFEPDVRITVEFMHWTSAGAPRFPVFKGFAGWIH